MKTLALLIGNSNYPSSRLLNPCNDAIDLGNKLNELGFYTLSLEDLPVEEMDRNLTLFGETLKKYDVGLFFFAGHGMQIEGENYLAAINTKMDSELNAKYSALPLNKIIDIMERAGNRTRIIILDACRDNPFERAWSRSGTSRGLAPVYAPKGTIVAFATSPGQVAWDGEGRNGAYTSGLLKHIGDQDIQIEDMFKRIRNTVSVITDGKQTSWEHTSLMGSFYFNSSALDARQIAAYSRNAKEDESFVLNGEDKCHQLIQRLKSYNWYAQNPAIDSFDKCDFSSIDKNSLFVLGRNIYQVACGGSSSGATFIQNLSSHLKVHNGDISFHIYNGILFEIYFDKAGKFRKSPKVDCFNEVLRCEDVEEIKNSFGFIAHELHPYTDSLFYVPGSQRTIIIDLRTSEKESGEFLIQAVSFEGENILRKDDRSVHFTFSTDESYTPYLFKKYEDYLSKNMLVPIHRLVVKADRDLNSESKLLFPDGYFVSRLPKIV